MFGFFSRKLTEYSKHYLDWSRVGELLRSGHHYSASEVLTRAGIAAITGISAYLGAHFNNPEKTGRSDLTLGLATGFLGFIISHTLAIYVLIKKRYDIMLNCEQLSDQIQEELDQIQPPLSAENKQQVIKTINTIMEISLSDDKHGRASETWGRRKRLLETLLNNLQGNPELFENTLQLPTPNKSVRSRHAQSR